MPLVDIVETATGLSATCEQSGDEAIFVSAPGISDAEARANALKILNSTCSCGARDHREER